MLISWITSPEGIFWTEYQSRYWGIVHKVCSLSIFLGISEAISKFNKLNVFRNVIFFIVKFIDVKNLRNNWRGVKTCFNANLIYGIRVKNPHRVHCQNASVWKCSQDGSIPTAFERLRLLCTTISPQTKNNWSLHFAIKDREWKLNISCCTNFSKARL